MSSFGPYDANSEALLCAQCARARQTNGPPLLSLAHNVVFGSPGRCNLPTLSLLETLLIRRVIPYAHIVKIVDGKTSYALSGHVISIATDAADRTADLSNARLVLPRRDIATFFSVTFIGAFDRWRRLINFTPDHPRNLITSYGALFRGTLSVLSTRTFYCS
jgi:hypothetical protein